LIDSPEIEHAISDMAGTIKLAMRELEGIISTSRVKETSLPSPMEPQKIDLTTFSLEVITFKQLKMDPGHDSLDLNYYVYTTTFDEIISAKALSSDEELTRLYKIIAKNNYALKMVYRRQIQDIVTYLSSGKTNDMSITFLVDNSGSMRGSKIVDTSSWMTILCEIFESAGIFVEVLGYTTKTWKGGQSREAWLP
jgi:cobaltochelatase CobT